jgi:CHAD domain-containing protein
MMSRRAPLSDKSRIAFATDDVVDLKRICITASGALDADAIARSTRNITLLDTPDRRLQKRSLRLEVDANPPARSKGHRSTRWRLFDSLDRERAAALVESRSKGEIPRFADDLPEGALQTALLPITEMRALLPWTRLQIHEERTCLRDRAGKIRLWITCLKYKIDDSDRPAALPTRIVVEALKGYQANADAVVASLKDTFGWSICSDDVAALVGWALGIVRTDIEAASPGSPAAPKALIIRTHTPAGPAMRGSLSRLLDTIDSRRDGVIADIDSEYLHEFRVAVRRSRSALQQLAAVFPQRAHDTMRNGYRWLGTVTSPTRDLDVHSLAFKAHCRAVTPDQARALAPLGVHLAKAKARAHQVLIKDLNSERYQTFITYCRTVLTDDDAVWTDTNIKRQPISDVVGKQVLKDYRKAVKHGAHIGPETEARALHNLRKKLKKLRYLIEFIRKLYPKDVIFPLLQKLKSLQQVLGEVQDLEIQTDALRRFGRELADVGTVHPDALPDTLMAIGAWAEDLDRQRAEARVRFAEVFAPFADQATAKAFRATFSPKRRSHVTRLGEPAP